MIAVPPWKAEFLEKRKMKERKDDVPLWKKELLKRLHSKSRKMSEEDQTDIIEEHIPKVSDNIFLVHEKHHHRHVKVPQPKKQEVKNDPKPTPPKPTVTEVNNVVIIEKEERNSNELLKQSGEGDSKEESTKEYPVAGIVHRLMDRFQRSGSSSNMKTTAFQTPPYQRSKSADVLNQQGSEIKKDSLVSPLHSPDKTSRTSVTSAEQKSPLLIGTAKPFSRQVTTNSREHRHVNVPFCKVPSPKHKAIKEAKNESKKETIISSPTANDSFTSDLSNLHSNQDGAIIKYESNSPKTSPNHKKKTSEPVFHRTNLVNGDSLHSSGNASTTDTTTVIQQEMKNQDNAQKQKKEASNVPPLPYKNLTDQKREPPVSSNKIHEKPNVASFGGKSSQQSKIVPRSKKKENELEKVSHESNDESSLKSPSKIAANGVINTSKTYKSTQSHQKQPETQSNVKQDQINNKNQVKDQQNRSKYKPSVQNTSKIEEKSEKNSVILPSTVIDDLITEPTSSSQPKSPIAITPVASLPVSEVKNTKQAKPTTDKKEPVPQRSQKVENSTKKVQSLAPSNTSVKSSQKVIEPSHKPPSFAHNFMNSSPQMGGGMSFVIDPSKFRRSSAVQQPTPAAAPPRNVLKDSGNRKVIIPQPRSDIKNEMEDNETQKTGKRKLTADQIQVIGGYISLERSCLMKENKKTKQPVSIKFSEKDLETTYTYISERSMLDSEPHPNTQSFSATPSFSKDAAIGKYTPKYLLSMKDGDIPDEEEESSATREGDDLPVTSTDATPLSDESATSWSGTTSQSTDILF